MSSETYALVREMVSAHPLPPINVKGISREIIPYVVDLQSMGSENGHVVVERLAGLDLYLDLEAVDEIGAARARGVLQGAILALERKVGHADANIDPPLAAAS